MISVNLATLDLTKKSFKTLNARLNMTILKLLQLIEYTVDCTYNFFFQNYRVSLYRVSVSSFKLDCESFWDIVQMSEDLIWDLLAWLFWLIVERMKERLGIRPRRRTLQLAVKPKPSIPFNSLESLSLLKMQTWFWFQLFDRVFSTLVGWTLMKKWVL